MVKVVFCVPGQLFSNTFLQCWTDLILACPHLGVQPLCPVFPYISNVYISRNVCLLGRPELGINQKPFQGKIDYDYLMWIDSDSEWKIRDFKNLLDLMEANRHIHILSGVYMHGNGETLVTIDEGGDLVVPSELENMSELVKMPYTGMGFMMVRRGVFEYIRYPWFIPILPKDEQGNIIDIMGDDIAFCERAKEVGFDTWIATRIRIGHEKPRVLKVPDERAEILRTQQVL
jgi:hypothetical protein